MTVTTLDPRTALIIVDLQRRIVFLPTAHPVTQVGRCASDLADCFRSRRLPVIMVNVAGLPSSRTERSWSTGELPAGFDGFLLELSPRREDYVVSKRTAGAFIETDLGAFLVSIGITQVVLAGVATSMGVASTARQAHELGFKVTLAVDAMTDLDAELHAFTVARVFPSLGETGTVAEIIDLLAVQHG